MPAERQQDALTVPSLPRLGWQDLDYERQERIPFLERQWGPSPFHDIGKRLFLKHFWGQTVWVHLYDQTRHE